MNASRNRPAGSLRSVTFTAGRVILDDGADASRHAIGAADYHPLSVRRKAPAI
jgi:hypothetical protein